MTIMFDDRFEAVLADTPQARKIHHRIRFLVYCLETGYENAAAHPDGLEKDAWDKSSVQFLVRRRDNGAWIGAMRLVLTKNQQPLPIETICRLEETVVGSLDRRRIAEASRLCMVEHYRRRSAEHDVPYEIVDRDSGRRQQLLPFAIEKRTTQRRHSSEIMLGLLLAAADYSREIGLSHWYFLTSPMLCRILGRYGFHLEPAGDPCRYRGERNPYLVDIRQAYEALKQGDPGISAWLEGRRAFRRYSEIPTVAGLPEVPMEAGFPLASSVA